MPKTKGADPQDGVQPRPAARHLVGPFALGAVLLIAVLLLLSRGRGQPATALLPTPQQEPGTPTARALPPTATPEPTVAASPTPAPTETAQPTAPAPGVLTSVDQVQRIEPAEAKALMDQGQAVLYDVRSQSSYETKHAAGALSLPYDQVASSAASLPKGKILILYCT